MQQRFLLVTTLVASALAGCTTRTVTLEGHSVTAIPLVNVAALPASGTVSKRFLSYNIEMLELTGGRFWKPYGSDQGSTADMYEYRPPIDLDNPRLRKLANALAPAYVRYSGTWANATTLAENDAQTQRIPRGYDGLLTHKQWRKAVEFARDSGAEIVTSMPTSPGARQANGIWMPAAAERLFAYTKSIGGKIAAAEFANEPNLIGGTKPPANYGAPEYRRDFGIFVDWVRKWSPDTLVLGPGALELGRGSTFPPSIRTLPVAELASAGPDRPDVVSFHFYGAVSLRCKGPKDIDPLSDAWLSKIDGAIEETRKVRDRINPSAPIWLTETGEAACGGNPHAKTFADTFRYVDQLARSARQGVQVVMHNTLAASDYALLDEHTFAPRPNYWAAYLWKRTMGSIVLDSGRVFEDDSVRVYAHCLRDVSGGVTILAINPDRVRARTMRVEGQARIYSLTQPTGQPDSIALNGKVLELVAGTSFPQMDARLQQGRITVPAASINFITIPKANNAACLSRPSA